MIDTLDTRYIRNCARILAKAVFAVIGDRDVDRPLTRVAIGLQKQGLTPKDLISNREAQLAIEAVAQVELTIEKLKRLDWPDIKLSYVWTDVVNLASYKLANLRNKIK